MAERREQVLAIDADVDMVRGIVLAGGSIVVAGGYAQLALGSGHDPAAFAARIASALDPDSLLPVVVCCHESHDAKANNAMVAAISAAGFASVSSVDRVEARRRTNPSETTATALVGVDIPAGLLTSHDHLTLDDLAAVTGAGLGLLGVVAQPADADGEPKVEVWSPENPAPPAVHTDTSIAAPIAAGASEVDAVDDVTVPADRSGIPTSETVTPSTEPATQSDVVDDDDLVSGSAVAAEGDTAPHSAEADSAPEDADMASDATIATERAAATGPPPAPMTATLRTASAPDDAIDVDSVAVGASVTSGKTESSRRLLPLLVAAVVLALVFALLVSQCGDDDVATVDTDTAPDATDTAPVVAANGESDPTDVAEPTAVPAAVPTMTEAPTAEPTPEPTAAPTPTDVPTAEPTPEPTVDPLEGLPPLSSLPERGAIFRPPTLFLEGAVQTQEQADALYGRAVAVVGPDNVVNNYVVRPDAPPALDGNVRVEQAVLFDAGSAAISEQFIPTLELGVAVMALNPQVQMVVEGHTDSVGTEESNLALSERRAQAVVDYLVSRGVDLARLEAVGLGEAAPVAPNDSAEGRQINRRIEVDLLDLLAGE